ncbi:MAG: porin family protein, partial [Bacteroidia bacterium]|nr:porin family protein [Bacteroidia bacterium]
KTLTSGSTSYIVKKAEGVGYGFHGGVFLRVNISKLYIQPEVLFSTRSNNYTLSKINTAVDSVTLGQTFNKVDIPIMIGVKLGPVRINAGPVGSFAIGSPKELIANKPDFEAMYAKMTFGYQAGLGVDIIKKVTVDLRYEGSLSKYQSKLGDFALDDRPNAFLLSIGYMF